MRIWHDADICLLRGHCSSMDLPREEQLAPTFPRLGNVLSALYDEYLGLLCVLTGDGVVKVVGEAGSSAIELPGAPYSSLLLVRNLHLLLLDTSSGRLRLYLWPLLRIAPASGFQTFPIHSSRITHIAPSEAPNTIVTASVDGSVFLYAMVICAQALVCTPKHSYTRAILGLLCNYFLNTVVLVRTTTVEALKVKISDLEDSISTLSSQQRYANVLKDLKRAEEIGMFRREYEDKTRFELDYSAGLKREMEAITREYEATLKAKKARWLSWWKRTSSG